MAAIDDLYIRILADGSQLGAGLNQAQGKLDVFGSGVSKIGGMLAGAFSVVAIERFLSASITAYEDSAKSAAKVAQAIKTTNGVAGFSFEQLNDAAVAFQHSTLFEDDAIMNDVTAQLLTFTNITGEGFKRAQVAALDLSTVLGSDLKGTAIQLGKALEDPIKGVTALTRSGVTFTAAQKELISGFVATNQLGKAQALILDEIANKYGGQAEAAAKASTGITQLSNSFGDLMENMGGAIANSDTFKSGISDMGTMAEIMGRSDYSGLEKFFALLDPWADETLKAKKLQEDIIKSQAHIDQMAKDRASGTTAPTPGPKKATTYADLKQELSDLQASQAEATQETIGGINQEIEAVKAKIKVWDDSGKAVVNYKGTIKGLQMELDLLNTKRDTTSGAANVAAVNAQISKKEEEIEVLKKATAAWIAYGAGMTQSITAMAAKSGLLAMPKVELESNAAFAAQAMDKAEKEAERMAAFNEAINGVITNGLASTIGSMTEAAVAGGDVGAAMLGGFGAMLTQLGQMVLQTGIGILAAKMALKTLNPFVAIAAGIGLIAIGSAFSNGAKSLAGSSGSGGGGSYGSSGNGISDVTGGAQPINVIVTGTLVGTGKELNAVLTNANNYDKRTGR